MIKFKATKIEDGTTVYGIGYCPSDETNIWGEQFEPGEVGYLFVEKLMNWVDGCEFEHCGKFEFVYANTVEIVDNE